MFYSFFFSIFFPLHILCEANYGKLLDPDAAAIFQQRLTDITSTLETMPKQILKKYIWMQYTWVNSFILKYV